MADHFKAINLDVWGRIKLMKVDLAKHELTREILGEMGILNKFEYSFLTVKEVLTLNFDNQ